MCSSPELDAYVSRAVTLFPEDTVLGALQLMYRHGARVLPVVDGTRGELLGEVTLDELHRLSRRMPLTRMAEILTAKARAVREETTDAEEEDRAGDSSSVGWH
ncbi:CBS domain-containing protein [Corallococcus sp. M34]|uniref:CBS domain-containing protein n=1 Tax=Citreicoccus inhibens TaxID=2849499 RepID=UPI001C237BBF|nr:CBS domain-containing protein [Citreicoccus inhibens]MBU8900153.1 CBS domain-containing protein [Citreicoccus inhibens]